MSKKVYKIKVERKVNTFLSDSPHAEYRLSLKRWFGWTYLNDYTKVQHYNKFLLLCNQFNKTLEITKIGDWKTNPEL